MSINMLVPWFDTFVEEGLFYQASIMDEFKRGINDRFTCSWKRTKSKRGDLLGYHVTLKRESDIVKSSKRLQLSAEPTFADNTPMVEYSLYNGKYYISDKKVVENCPLSYSPSILPEDRSPVHSSDALARKGTLDEPATLEQGGFYQLLFARLDALGKKTRDYSLHDIVTRSNS